MHWSCNWLYTLERTRAFSSFDPSVSWFALMYMTKSDSFVFCSAGGGQHADDHHRFCCWRSYCAAHGLHAAEELHSLCSFQAWGEKVSSLFLFLFLFLRARHFGIHQKSWKFMLCQYGEHSVVPDTSMRSDPDVWDAVGVCSSFESLYSFPPPTPVQ